MTETAPINTETPEGAESLDQITEGLIPEEGGDGEEVTPETLGIDISSLPPEAQEQVQDALGKVVKYLHASREADSAHLRELAEKAEKYEQMSTMPQPYQPVQPAQPPKEEKSAILDPQELADAAREPAKFAKLLESAMSKVAESMVARVLDTRVGPLEDRTRVMGEIAAMDAAYPGTDLYPSWRKYAPQIRTYIASHPGETDIRAIFERQFLIPHLSKSVAKQRLTSGATSSAKRDVIARLPGGMNAAKAKDNPQATTVETVEEAILATLADWERQPSRS